MWVQHWEEIAWNFENAHVWFLSVCDILVLCMYARFVYDDHFNASTDDAAAAAVVAFTGSAAVEYPLL